VLWVMQLFLPLWVTPGPGSTSSDSNSLSSAILGLGIRTVEYWVSKKL